MRASLGEWSLRSVVEGWMALRGVELVTAMTVLAELGDLTRFDSPRELMSFLGLVPSEHSSGGRRRRGGITKTGNGHVRRVLVEAAWSYRFPARKTAHPRRKAQATAPAVQAIAWAAQKRLCARYWHLYCTTRARRSASFHDCGGLRAGGVPLGGGLRDDGPASHHARIGLSDEPERRGIVAPCVCRASGDRVQCVGVRAWQAGEENPRRDYEGSAPSRPTHANRPRPLRDEVKSGGRQPADIRGTHRRESCRPRPDPNPLREATSRDDTAT